jgi:hypothetical protein
MADDSKQPEKNDQARRLEEQRQRLTESMRREVKIFEKIVKAHRYDRKK